MAYSKPINGEGKYDVYKNDLKFKKNRHIDVERAIWNENNYKEMFDNINFDSLEYRLIECKNADYHTLDLSHMDLKTFPKIPNNIKSRIKFLFITDNELTELQNLDEYINLEIIDMSHNKIDKIVSLPKSIIEINCKYNNVAQLPDENECPNIIRIDCSFNKLKSIPKYKNIINIVCNNNDIEKIGTYDKLEKLLCFNNKIITINECEKLKYLDCSNNLLTSLDDMKLDHLTDLLISNNKICELKIFKKIKYIEMFGTNINTVPYIDTLEEIFCYNGTIKEISKSYTVNKNIDIKVHKDKILHITFNEKQKT